MNHQNQKAFADFRKKLELLLGDFDESAKRVVSQQANIGMSVTKQNTPAPTGYLRRAWRRGKTIKVGNAHVSSYTNIVDYGLYVNNGHRTVNSKKETTGWVPGFHMLEQGVDEARRQLPAIFDNEIARIKRKEGF